MVFLVLFFSYPLLFSFYFLNIHSFIDIAPSIISFSFSQPCSAHTYLRTLFSSSLDDTSLYQLQLDSLPHSYLLLPRPKSVL
ncbi:hypothetical protein BCR41DRAFT_101403 [Lobosporangium transversale]|uniref:Uncharacterized protein n=1 Tax=Lobosporangium transversale TaxID=64571 RepID=A0A1Y2GJ90_9FUNG|nr:hypothetical protein BCR41DRAFT_101403 [Lobosporangium transversale]ORZ12530.1 hypothetical protein BCR41DRAFT_101403 [Lobosporangium transversale]|eukprot:XP_021880149.1 hypothetical protein BCR41DRAFT_101403 [Lobosporangium transversale]